MTGWLLALSPIVVLLLSYLTRTAFYPLMQSGGLWGMLAVPIWCYAAGVLGGICSGLLRPKGKSALRSLVLSLLAVLVLTAAYLCYRFYAAETVRMVDQETVPMILGVMLITALLGAHKGRLWPLAGMTLCCIAEISVLSYLGIKSVGMRSVPRYWTALAQLLPMVLLIATGVLSVWKADLNKVSGIAVGILAVLLLIPTLLYAAMYAFSGYNNAFNGAVFNFLRTLPKSSVVTVYLCYVFTGSCGALAVRKLIARK